MKRVITVVLAALMLAMSAAPALATTQKGLVNVNVEDVAVQVPIGVAANVCGVDANILAQHKGDNTPVCDADASAIPTAFL